MRLIDSDKLRVEVVHSGNIICLPHFSLEQINTAPVVDAIPIDWLRMWFTKKASLIGITLMSEIESDWERENETDRCR